MSELTADLNLFTCLLRRAIKVLRLEVTRTCDQSGASNNSDINAIPNDPEFILGEGREGSERGSHKCVDYTVFINTLIILFVP